MAVPIITLTTDFGLADHYAGVMKGVILGICPRARIVDLSHEIPPYDVGQAGYVIEAAWRYFPRKTVHIVVVDPGVGSARRPILVEAGGQYFIGPDNGVLAPVYTAEKSKVRLISEQKYFLESVSRTFHGRDVFAPVAAHVAGGVPPARAGKLIEDYFRPASQKPYQSGKHRWNGAVLRMDRFGNLITNFEVSAFPDLERRDFTMIIGPVETSVLVRSYTECGPGELFVIAGSSGYYEVSVNQGSAAGQIRCQVGAPVELVIWK